MLEELLWYGSFVDLLQCPNHPGNSLNSDAISDMSNWSQTHIKTLKSGCGRRLDPDTTVKICLSCSLLHFHFLFASTPELGDSTLSTNSHI